MKITKTIVYLVIRELKGTAFLRHAVHHNYNHFRTLTSLTFYTYYNTRRCAESIKSS